MKCMSPSRPSAVRGGSIALSFLLLSVDGHGASQPPGEGHRPPGEVHGLREKAVALYDAGRYADALPILESLDAAGRADGPILYRLFICLNEAHRGDDARTALERAALKLQAENVEAKSLEAPFYLANAYRNLQRLSEVQPVAAQATAKVESGAFSQPGRGIEMFQLAKLYEDQDRTEDAARWYRKALEAIPAQGGGYPNNMRWAGRYLAQLAFSKADFAGAQAGYAALVAMGGASPLEYDRLAVACVRTGNWRGAADAWREEVKLDPAEADRPRYSGQLAELAAGIGSLPAAEGSGRSFKLFSREELEALLLEQANAVRETRALATSTKDPRTDRAALEKRLARAKEIFVAAGLEYASRRLPISDVAFVGGYATLIFQQAEWELPANPAAAKESPAPKEP